MSAPQARWTRVSRTAVGVARVRARESARADALFDDPYAAVFVDALSDPTAASAKPSPLASALAFHIVIRTRFYDDHLLEACSAGCRQVVLLAAGLDTRAFRLSWPVGVRLYELDLPDVVAAKQDVLERNRAVAQCARTCLGIDLLQDWRRPLLAAGFDPTQPTAWLAEGLLVYLGATEAASLLSTVTELSAPASRLAFEQGRAASALRGAGAADPDSAVTLWQGGLGEAAGRWLAERGWAVRLTDLASAAEAYGRPAAGPTGSGFIAATYDPAS